MYTQEEIKKFIIVDIETTSGYRTYKEFYAEKENEVKFWDKKVPIVTNHPPQIKNSRNIINESCIFILLFMIVL